MAYTDTRQDVHAKRKAEVWPRERVESHPIRPGWIKVVTVAAVLGLVAGFVGSRVVAGGEGPNPEEIAELRALEAPAYYRGFWLAELQRIQQQRGQEMAAYQRGLWKAELQRIQAQRGQEMAAFHRGLWDTELQRIQAQRAEEMAVYHAERWVEERRSSD